MTRSIKSLDDLGLTANELIATSPGRKYEVKFEHVKNGLFKLYSSGYLDDAAIKMQFQIGDKIRAHMQQFDPSIKYELIWDISMLQGVSMFSRRFLLRKLRETTLIQSVLLLGENLWSRNFANTFSKMVPSIQIHFFATEEELNKYLADFSSSKVEEPSAEYKKRTTLVPASPPSFMDLWNQKKEMITIAERKYKVYHKENWTYEAVDKNFRSEYSIIENNIVLCDMQGFVSHLDVVATYSMLEEIMDLFGFNEENNKFYTITLFSKIRGTSLQARKTTAHYEELYNKRAYMVVIVPSAPVHFALKIQKKLTPQPFHHWALASSLQDAMSLIQLHKQGSMIDKSRFSLHNEIAEKELVIPDDKKQMAELIKKLHQKLKDFETLQSDQLEKLQLITGRMTWDETFNLPIEKSFNDDNPFQNIFNSIAVLQEDFKEILQEKDRQSSLLKESEYKATNIVNLASDIIAVFQDGQVKFTNPRVKQLLGYEPKEVLNMSIEDFVRDDQVTVLLGNYYRRIVGDELPSLYESMLLHKDGHEIPVSINACAIEFDKKPATLVIIRDITLKRKIEAELEHYRNHLEELVEERSMQLEQEIVEKEEAQWSGHLKSAFIANISHEIRTPMNAILAFSNFLKDPSLTEEKHNEYLEYIQSSGNTLLALIDDLLDIAKIEAKQIKINKINCALNKLLSELYAYFDDYRQKKEIKDINLECVNPIHNDSMVIFTDCNRLRQVLSNLLENAFKFTDKGKISFGYEIVENPCGDEPGILKFFVSDTGLGIPPSKIDYIFSRFGKLEQHDRRNPGGSGLGLAISKNLVELLGGEMWVDSEPGKGSNFQFTIPYEAGHSLFINNSIKTAQQMTNTYNWKNKTILIVEDELLNFKVIQIALHKTNIGILYARDGQEAVNIVKKNSNIDLILMDIQMPLMDGFEATEIIKKHAHTVPVIAQTAFAMNEEKEKCLRAGFDDYIIKPIDLQELMHKLSHYLN
jgi:PAS domain S-box-containing protein